MNKRLSVGAQIGILTLVRRVRVRGIRLRWECVCECGTRKLIFSHKFRKVRPVKSCGCLFIKFTARKPLAGHYEVDENNCWNWLGSLSCGYGTWRGEHAHRTVYKELVGPIPEGYELHHKCKNRRCVNPDHCVPLTVAEHNLIHNPVRVGVSILWCRKGHALTPDNIVVRKKGRECRACRNTAARCYWHTKDRKNPKVRQALKLSSRVTLER